MTLIRPFRVVVAAVVALACSERFCTTAFVLPSSTSTSTPTTRFTTTSLQDFKTSSYLSDLPANDVRGGGSASVNVLDAPPPVLEAEPLDMIMEPYEAAGPLALAEPAPPLYDDLDMYRVDMSDLNSEYRHHRGPYRRPWRGGRNNYYDHTRPMRLYDRPSPSQYHHNQVHGGSRQTYSNPYHYGHGSSSVHLTSEGRPIDADVEVWQGPGNVAQKVRVYSEDGWYRPVQLGVETHGSHAVSVRNAGPMAYPFSAHVQETYGGYGGYGGPSRGMYGRGGRMMGSGRYDSGYGRCYRSRGYRTMGPAETVRVDGNGALKTFHFPGQEVVSEVQIVLTSEGLPIMATVEVWQGPNSVKTVADVYSEDGYSKPFRAVIPTPGYGSVIAVRNQGPMEYPLTATAQPVG